MKPLLFIMKSLISGMKSLVFSMKSHLVAAGLVDGDDLVDDVILT